ncbi:MAG: hypothetical protein R3E10_13405 [Gemmatimonadota bacterium]
MRRVVGAGFFLVGVALLVLTLSLSGPARRIPLVVAVPLVALLGLELARELRGTVTPSLPRARELPALLWTATLPLGIALLGVVGGPALFVAALLRFHGREAWPTALLAGAATAVGMALVVGALLHMSLPPGLLLAPLVS